MEAYFWTFCYKTDHCTVHTALSCTFEKRKQMNRILLQTVQTKVCLQVCTSAKKIKFLVCWRILIICFFDCYQYIWDLVRNWPMNISWCLNFETVFSIGHWFDSWQQKLSTCLVDQPKSKVWNYDIWLILK